LNRCLDNAIAAAVTAWNERDSENSTSDEKLRQLVSGSLAIFSMLRDGKLGTSGSSVAVLGRHLEEMRDLLASRRTT
jgi:DNA phosphorothioation-dependent restriction protein DptG